MVRHWLLTAPYAVRTVLLVSHGISLFLSPAILILLMQRINSTKYIREHSDGTVSPIRTATNTRTIHIVSLYTRIYYKHSHTYSHRLSRIGSHTHRITKPADLTVYKKTKIFYFSRLYIWYIDSLLV